MEPLKYDLTLDNEMLQKVVGARLTSVYFVLDYVMLGFDERGGLTALVWPILFRNGEELRFGQNGYRDGLCELIGGTVEKASISLDETISISFGGGVLIEIPLGTRTDGCERATFNIPREHLLRVW